MTKKLQRLVLKLSMFDPAEPRHLRGSGIHLRKLGSGCFRDTYLVKGYDVVLKFPQGQQVSNVVHSSEEIRQINRILKLKTLSKLRPLCPKIYYKNDFGVVAMERCWLTGISGDQIDYAIDFVTDLFGPENHDVNRGNIGRTRRGALKILDFGYLEG